MRTGWALCSKWFFSLCSKWKEKTSEPSNCFFRWHRTTTGKGVNPAAHWIIIKGDAIAGAWWSAWTMMISVMAATTMMIKSTWRRTVSPSKLSPAATLVNSLSPDRGGQLAWGVSWFVFFFSLRCADTKKRYIPYFKFAFYRMIGEEVVDGNGTTVGGGSSSETKSKPNEKDWENTPGKN